MSSSELREGLAWVREGRPPTVGEARDYFDAHARDGGDPETMEECERVLDAVRNPIHDRPGSDNGGAKASPFPPPAEDLIEEEGSD